MCLCYDSKSGQPLTVFTRTDSNQWTSDNSHETLSEEELFTNWMCLRTKFALNFSSNSNDGCNYKNWLLKVLTNVEKAITSTHTPMFEVAETNIVLEDNKNIDGIGKSSKILDLLNQVKKCQNAQAKKKQGDSAPTRHNCLNFNTLLNWSSEKDEDDTFYGIFSNNSKFLLYTYIHFLTP